METPGWLRDLSGDWSLPAAATDATAEITRWRDSSWPRLVRGQRVTAWDREWRVTDVHASLTGDETYRLEPAGVVDARIAAARLAP